MTTEEMIPAAIVAFRFSITAVRNAKCFAGEHILIVQVFGCMVSRQEGLPGDLERENCVSVRVNEDRIFRRRIYCRPYSGLSTYCDDQLLGWLTRRCLLMLGHESEFLSDCE